MKVAVTGATGFIGRYIVEQLAAAGHVCRCWYRSAGSNAGFENLGLQVEWVPGELGQAEAGRDLLQGCAAVIHSALYHPGLGFQGGEGHLLEFVQKNVLGTLQLIEQARALGVQRFVFISTCAVHDRILGDRPLDETHPLWPHSHYGAHKAAIEKFVHSYGLGSGYPICALRPTGVYGVARPVMESKWYGLVRSVVRGADVECRRGGKEVHAADVARAAELLLTADGIAGEAYACYDRYVSEFEVATLAREFAGSTTRIGGTQTTPRNEIVTAKLRALGMQFGGRPLLEQTVRALVEAARNDTAAA